MKLVRCGDRDDVDLRIGDERAPVCGPTFKTKLLRPLRCEPSVDLAEEHQAGTHDVAINRRDGIPGERVALAHIAGADEADADRVHPQVAVTEHTVLARYVDLRVRLPQQRAELWIEIESRSDHSSQL